MAPKKKTNDRNRQQGRPRTSTAVRAQARAQRRRKLLTGGTAILIIGAIVALIVGVGAAGKDASSTTTSSTAAPTTTIASVTGKPCVKVAGALPKGAPAVPVQVGPAPTTLVIKDLKAGTGAVVKKGANVTVDYIGVACSTGKIFDSSYSRNQPASFGLSGVIEGWQQGIPGMRVGGERLLGIPSDLGYGAQGSAPDIAPGEALWFVVHVRSSK